jgi:poly-gamma-glutamate capsule biosynthesis protein CapA/YwtB (metallophosphatase superfamily)
VPFAFTAVEPNMIVTELLGLNICPVTVTKVFAMSVDGVRDTWAAFAAVDVDTVAVVLGVNAGSIR